jgi:ABC-type methionine transport system permease subunit
MGKTHLILILFILFLFAAFLAIIGLASYKLIKSKLPDWEKVYWIVAMVVLNIIAAIPFILFHDYFLSPEKRSI